MRQTYPALTLVAASCLTITAHAPAAIIQTAEPFIGITHHQIIEASDGSTAGGTINFPRPVVIHLVEIDPAAPGVSFLMQPGNGPLQGEVTRYTTPNFANTFGTQIALNGDFYADAGAGQANVTHTGVSQGNGYSPNWYTGQPIFNVDANNVASVLAARTPGGFDSLENIPLYNALGGNQRILTNGSITAPNDSYTNALNPHSALGVAPDGRVFLMAVDGRQGDFSSGMRTTEMASLFLHFGVTNAINIDGGGSTTLAFDDSNDGIANARVINSPSDLSSELSPGNPRLVANNFGVFATPNPDYIPLPSPPRPLAEGAVPLLTTLTILDDFEGSKGRFASARGVAGSGNVATYATRLDNTAPHQGFESLEITITNTGAQPSGMFARIPSGAALPSNNTQNGKAMARTGYVGFFIKLDPGQDPLYAAIQLDDGSPIQSGLERSNFIEIIPNGQWQLVQWNLEDSRLWSPRDNGDGDIDGPNTFIDSILLSAAPGDTGGPNWAGTLHLDTIAYNPNGDLASLIIPEPTSAAIFSLVTIGWIRRRSAA
ncbi:MAG: phosphodiester glycosidase family protein [Phycisphaeraceae bacterium]